MRSIAVGGIFAAIVMFALGFLFFGVLGMMIYAPLGAEDAAAVQAVLGSSLPATGSYMIPADEAAWMAGPSAVVNYVAAGGAPSMPMAMGITHGSNAALTVVSPSTADRTEIAGVIIESP